MRFAFFPADPPDDDENPFEQKYERVPSSEPPRDEVPALLAASEVLARGDDVVFALIGARVYSDGIEFLVSRYLRRGTRDARQWHLAQIDFSGHLGMGECAPDRLRWGLALGNGERLLLDDRFGPLTEPDVTSDETSKHTVRMTGGGGGGGGDVYTMHEGLWLWPLPPEGPLELVVQWPAFEIQESRVVLDGGQIRTLAASVRRLWD